MDSDVFLNLIKVEGRGAEVAEIFNKGDQENSLTRAFWQPTIFKCHFMIKFLSHWQDFETIISKWSDDSRLW